MSQLTVLTRKYQQATFRVDLTHDGEAYLLCKPLSATGQHEILKKLLAENAYDSSLASFKALTATLEVQIVGWGGLVDIQGQEVVYSKEMLKELCEVESALMSRQMERLKHIAREGRLEEEKN